MGYSRSKKPRLVITSALYDNNCLSFFAYEIAGFVKKVVNLQWEQVLSTYDEDNADCYHNPKGLAKLCNHLCWGIEPQKRLIKSGLTEKNCPIVGFIPIDR